MLTSSRTFEKRFYDKLLPIDTHLNHDENITSAKMLAENLIYCRKLSLFLIINRKKYYPVFYHQWTSFSLLGYLLQIVLNKKITILRQNIYTSNYDELLSKFSHSLVNFHTTFRITRNPMHIPVTSIVKC